MGSPHPKSPVRRALLGESARFYRNGSEPAREFALLYSFRGGDIVAGQPQFRARLPEDLLNAFHDFLACSGASFADLVEALVAAPIPKEQNLLKWLRSPTINEKELANFEARQEDLRRSEAKVKFEKANGSADDWFHAGRITALLEATRHGLTIDGENEIRTWLKKHDGPRTKVFGYFFKQGLGKVFDEWLKEA